DFETKANLVIDVQVRNPQGQTFTKRFTIQVTNANDAPHAIDLSNNRIDENQQPGVTVGTLSSQDVDAGDTHTYALADGAGSADNDLFRIEDNVLRTNALLDFETKPIYSVRIASTDNRGGAFAQIFLVNVNNLPSPPDAVANSLQSCTGDPITLVNQGAGITRVLVRIENITISDNTSDGCTVSGAMTITTNGSTVSSIPFSGVVNARDQFSDTSIPDFTIDMAGLPLVARGVEITYINENPALHIVRPLLQMPAQFGGLSNTIAAPTFIDSGGIRIGSASIDLPTITTESGFEMSLTATLEQRDGGFVLAADGSLTIPNIGKKKSSGEEGQECSISAGVTIFAGPDNRTVMMIAAGDALTQQRMGPFRANVAPAAVMAPQSFDAFRLEQIRAGLSCSPGLAIGTTGLFVTGLSGEITLIPGGERVDVTVTIEAGKSLPGIGPILAVEGSMGVQPRPFELDLGVALSVLSIEVARTEAKVTTNSFRASIQFEAIFFNGSAEINAFTRNGRATFTGSARVSLEVRKGSIVRAGKCFGRIRLCPPPIPPFSTGKLATVGADMG
ncbi:MAG: cadherin repeat domain-containing protein, partial [Caldilineaceae bacterium]|nr:cadherin repeat domain-containing protein [Caldilineaceae bacterium]